MLKKSDLVFLTLLRQDARQTLTEISRKTRIPISTLYDKLKIHEGRIILKHTTLLDFSKLGYSCKANIMLACQKEDKENLKNYLKESNNINSLFKINNGFDFIAEAVFESVNDLENFLDKIELAFHVIDKKVFYVMEDIKREQFMSTISFLNAS